MEQGGEEAKGVKVDFDQLVRIFVDTNVDTHFIVSLARTSTVAELRELVKVTHRHCYPDSGDVDIGKLAVPGGDFGYHLADFLLIGQVYDRYEGKVLAEVKNHEFAANSSQGVFRMPVLNCNPSLTQKKLPSLAPQPVGNVAGLISTNASERGALLPVGSSPCEARIELIVPKLQKEEVDEDGIYLLGSEEPLDGHPSRARALAVGTFEGIVDEKDEKFLERLSTAVDDGGGEFSGADVVPKADHSNPDMSLAEVHVKPDKISLGATHAVSSDILGVRRKRDSSKSNERPPKTRRLAEQDPSGNTSKAPLENGRHESCSGAIERSKDGSSNLDGMNEVSKDVNAAVLLSHMNRSGDLDANYLSSSGSKRKKKKALHICDLTISQNSSEAVKDAMIGVEDKEEIREKDIHGGSDLVTCSGAKFIGINDLEVGGEGKPLSLLEDGGVPQALDQKGKKNRNFKQEKSQKQEKEPEQEENTEKEKKQKQKIPEEENQPEQEKLLQHEKTAKKLKKQKQMEPDRDKQLEQEEENTKKKKKKQKLRTPEEENQPEQEKLLQHEKAAKKLKKLKTPEEEKQPEQGKQLQQERTEKLKKQKQKKPEQEKQSEQEKHRELKKQPEQHKTDKREKKGKEKKRKQEKTEKKDEKEKKEKKQMIDEITPLDCASLNPLLEESDKEPQQENGHLDAAAVSPNFSQDVDNDEEASGDDATDVRINKGSAAAAAVASDFRSRMGDEDSVRSSESEASQMEAQLSRDSSEGMTPNGATVGNVDDKGLQAKTNTFGDVNDVETSPSFQGGTETSPQTQGTKAGSGGSQETPNPSKHLSRTRAGRGAPSQTRSIESSKYMTEEKQIRGRDTKTNETQNSQCSEKATQQSEGINIGSEVSGAWLRRGMLESEPGHIDQSLVAKPGEVAHTRNIDESSAESDPRVADQTEVSSHQDVSRIEDQIPEALHANHISKTAETSKNHASASVKRSDDGEVNIKNDSLEFFSQDQSFHVAPTQVEKALSGSTTEDSSDESNGDPGEGTDELMKQTAGNLNVSLKGGGESQESSDESGDLAPPARRSSLSLTAKAPVPSVSKMTGNGSSQSFKRRASGIAAGIEAKFAQFIESQGGLDEIMGITLGQRKRSMPVESQTQVESGARSTGSLATPFGSPLDLASNTQESVMNSPIALDIAQASQNSAGTYFTPQFKVPKPVSTGTMSCGVQGKLFSAALPLAGREVPKARAAKELRLKRKESTPQVDKTNEPNVSLVKHKNASPLSALESSKETFLANMDAAEAKPKSAGNSSPLSPQETPMGVFLDDLNAGEKRKSSVEKSSEKKKRLEEIHLFSQFMIVNNTDHISDHENEKKLGSEDETKGPFGVDVDVNLVSPTSGKKSQELEVKKESVETGVVGSPDMFVLDASGTKRRKKSEKEGTRKKRMKFLPEELDGKEVNILPENSVERSARETEELYFKLENANRDLWLQNNSVSSFRKEEEKIGKCDYPAADLDDTEGGEDVAQSRLVGGETEIDESGSDKLRLVGDTGVHEGDAAHRDPSPELFAGTTEASDREDSAFQSQDEKAETSQQDKFQSSDIFDFVSGDDLPTKVLSKSAKKTETNEKKKAKRMEELSGRAVQRVLEDEMLHIVDTNDVASKKPRKDAKPVKWTVRMRELSPSALATSPHGGTVPSNTPEVRSSPIIPKSAGGSVGKGRVRVKREVADPKPRKVTRAPKTPTLKQPGGGEICPVGCGKLYSAKTSAYYLHKAKCTGAPL